MTLHATFDPEAAAPAAAAPLRVAALSDGLAALFFDAPVAGRVALRRPGAAGSALLVARLPRADGGLRVLVLTAAPAVELCRLGAEIVAGGAVVARIDPLALQSPLVDPLALLAGLGEAGALRLLRLVLTTGASLFGGGALEGFGALAGQLVEQLAAPATVPLEAAAVGRRGAVLTYAFGGAEAPEAGALLVLGGGRARRLTGAAVLTEGSGAGRRLHLCLGRRLAPGEVVVSFAGRPLRFGAPQALGTFASWLEARSGAVRAAAAGWLAGAAAADANAAALAEELACPEAEAPKGRLLHLAATPAGLLVLATLEDPRGLAAALRLTGPAGRGEVPLDHLAWHPAHGPVAAGFVPLAGSAPGPVRAALVWRSGRLTPLLSAEAEPLRAVPEAWRAMPEAAAEPLAAALATVGPAPARRRRVEAFGALPKRPALAVVAAAGEATEYLHLLFAAVAAEPEARRILLVLHLPEGPAAGVLRETAAMLAAVHGLGVRLVSTAGATEAEALRAALAEGAAPAVLALFQGALPAEPGWAAAVRRALARRRSPVALAGETTDHEGRAVPGACVGLPRALAAALAAGRARLPDARGDVSASTRLRVGGLPPVVAYAPRRAPGAAEAAALARAASMIAAEG